MIKDKSKCFYTDEAGSCHLLGAKLESSEEEEDNVLDLPPSEHSNDIQDTQSDTKTKGLGERQPLRNLQQGTLHIYLECQPD